MGKLWKYVGIVILVFIVIPILLTVFGVFEIHLGGILKKKQENVERQVFEKTQSYVHGKVQELAKMYEEWEEKPEERDTIEKLIKIKFAEFDEKNIKSDGLRNFLVKTRGY